MKNKDTWSRSIVWGDDYTEQEPGMVDEQSVRLALPRMTPSLLGGRGPVTNSALGNR